MAQDRLFWNKVVNNKHNRRKEEKGKGKTSKGKGRGGNRPNAEAASSSSANAEPPYEGAVLCPLCNKWQKGQRGLSKHTAYVHTEGTNKAEGFTCDIHPCTYHTPMLFTLNRHKSTQHVPGCCFCLYCKVCCKDRKSVLNHMYQCKHRPPGAIVTEDAKKV